MKRYSLPFLAILFVIALLAGCGMPSAATPATPPPAPTAGAPAPTLAPTASNAAESGIIKIVSSMPRSGKPKIRTDKVVQAIHQRLEEDSYQACGGRFTIAYEDMDNMAPGSNSWDAQQETSNAQKAAADPDVMVYIGPPNSGAAKVSIPILNRVGLVMISDFATYPGLTKAAKGEGGEPEIYYPSGSRNFARVIATDDIQGVVAADWAEELGARQVYILHDGEAYGQGIADIFRTKAKALGIALVGYDQIDKKAQSYEALVGKIIAAAPDLIYFGGIVANHPDIILKELRAAGYQGMFMGAESIYNETFLNGAGADGEGVYVTFGGMPPNKLTGRGATWYNAYKQKFAHEPPESAVFAYEAVSVAMAAINNVCKKDRAAILAAVFATKDFEGALGRWSFDANGDTSLTTMSGLQVKNGKFEFIKPLGAQE